MAKTKENNFAYTCYETQQDIPSDELALLQAASAARQDAYAAYSHFLVGAALLMEDGEILTGNNQENAAFPSSLCAERVAIYHAGATRPGKKILKIAICGGPRDSHNERPVSPCGACRQAILEYAQKQGCPIVVIFAGVEPAPAIRVNDIADLLPFNFGADFL